MQGCHSGDSRSGQPQKREAPKHPTPKYEESPAWKRRSRDQSRLQAFLARLCQDCIVPGGTELDLEACVKHARECANQPEWTLELLILEYQTLRAAVQGGSEALLKAIDAALPAAVEEFLRIRLRRQYQRENENRRRL